VVVYKKLFSEDNEYGHHRYIDIGNGKKFHVVENGNTDGPLVFFLHGFPQVSTNNRASMLKSQSFMSIF
jgi:pimeloyl-ACP methyl ester carboxylesterase